MLTPVTGVTSPLALLPVGTVLMVGLQTRAHVLEGLTIAQLARKVRVAAVFIANGCLHGGIFFFYLRLTLALFAVLTFDCSGWSRC